MAGWDILDKLISSLPPIAAMLFLLAVGIIFAIGFFRHGVNFIKYGFKQTILDASLEKRFDDLGARIDARMDSFDKRMGGLETKLACIETNHFGHLKNFLTELTSILLDKGVLNNQDKARLDNQLRGMQLEKLAEFAPFSLGGRGVTLYNIRIYI